MTNGWTDVANCDVVLVMGGNPAENHPVGFRFVMEAKRHRKARLVCIDPRFNRTAAFWKSRELAGRYYPEALDPAGIQTEVFLLPAACFAEKDGAFVNSSRWLQWKYAALDPPGQAKRDQDMIAGLFLKIRELYRSEGGTAPEPLLNMAWDYSNQKSPSLQEVAQEINGREIASGRQVSGFDELKDDGSTLCGNWLYSGSFTEEGNQMARRGQACGTCRQYIHFIDFGRDSTAVPEVDEMAALPLDVWARERGYRKI